MRIRIARSCDNEAWEAYVRTHAGGTPFHAPAWSSTVATTLRHRECHLIADRDEKIVGLLPLVIVDSPLTGIRALSTPLAGYGGPLADESNIADALIRRACAVTRAVGGRHLELHFAGEQDVAPSATSMRRSDLHCGFREPLPENPDEVLRRLRRDARRMVRLGIKAGLRARELELEASRDWLHAAHGLVGRTMRDLGTPCYPLALLRGLLDSPATWFVWGVRDGERLVAAVWVARHGDTLFPHFSGADPAYRRAGVNNFLYATLMQEGVQRGYRHFDFGRSKVGSGAYDFKRHLGFTPRPLGYRYYLAATSRVPRISPANPRYAAAVSLWRRLPLPITRKLGPALVGHFA